MSGPAYREELKGVSRSLAVDQQYISYNSPDPTHSERVGGDLDSYIIYIADQLPVFKMSSVERVLPRLPIVKTITTRILTGLENPNCTP